MSVSIRPLARFSARLAVALVALLVVSLAANVGHAQVIQQAIGGISVDANGVLTNAELDLTNRLRQLRLEVAHAVPGDMSQPTELRKISLKQLDAVIAQHLADGSPLPDEVKYLAGLQRIKYVLVYPEHNDIVLAGFGEGWKVDNRGNVVGLTTGRPVLLLDDLLVALRTGELAANGGISCSIDPTKDGLQRLQAFMKTQNTIGPDPLATINNIQETLGAQTITVSGVPSNSHFARVLVAADYKMKRLAMKFDEAPIAGLPSFLDMTKANGRGMRQMMPRWWLATDYDSLLTDAEGLTWELRGQGVKAFTEDDFATATGNREHTGKANPVAQKWADNMTHHFEALAAKEPIFGELRNIMDLAVVSALIYKENLAAKSSFSMPTLLNESDLVTEEYYVPSKVDSKASFVKKGRNWVISASGGVQINSWAIADKKEQTEALAPVREQAVAPQPDAWWWN